MSEREGTRKIPIVMSDRDYRILDGMAAQNNTDLAGLTREALIIGVALTKMLTEGGTLLLRRGLNAEPVELEIGNK